MDPIVVIKGEPWRVIGEGVEINGLVHCHLASTRRGRQQRNGWHPVQILEDIERSVLEAARRNADAPIEVGDLVLVINDQGVDCGEKVVTEIRVDDYGQAFYLSPTDAPWMHWRERNLTKVTQ